eukprot:g1041.t1
MSNRRMSRMTERQQIAYALEMSTRKRSLSNDFDALHERKSNLPRNVRFTSKKVAKKRTRTSLLTSNVSSSSSSDSESDDQENIPLAAAYRKRQSAKSSTRKSNKKKIVETEKGKTPLRGSQTSSSKLPLPSARLPLGYHTWTERRKNAWNNISNDPNAYYFRYCPPGEKVRPPKWTENESLYFLSLLHTHPPWDPLVVCTEVKDSVRDASASWGLFALHLPGRTGKQCEQYYLKLGGYKVTKRLYEEKMSSCKEHFGSHLVEILRSLRENSVVDCTPFLKLAQDRKKESRGLSSSAYKTPKRYISNNVSSSNSKLDTVSSSRKRRRKSLNNAATASGASKAMKKKSQFSKVLKTKKRRRLEPVGNSTAPPPTKSSSTRKESREFSSPAMTPFHTPTPGGSLEDIARSRSRQEIEKVRREERRAFREKRLETKMRSSQKILSSSAKGKSNSTPVPYGRSKKTGMRYLYNSIKQSAKAEHVKEIASYLVSIPKLRWKLGGKSGKVIEIEVEEEQMKDEKKVENRTHFIPRPPSHAPPPSNEPVPVASSAASALVQIDVPQVSTLEKESDKKKKVIVQQCFQSDILQEASTAAKHLNKRCRKSLRRDKKIGEPLHDVARRNIEESNVWNRFCKNSITDVSSKSGFFNENLIGRMNMKEEETYSTLIARHSLEWNRLRISFDEKIKNLKTQSCDNLKSRFHNGCQFLLRSKNRTNRQRLRKRRKLNNENELHTQNISEMRSKIVQKFRSEAILMANRQYLEMTTGSNSANFFCNLNVNLAHFQ